MQIMHAFFLHATQAMFWEPVIQAIALLTRGNVFRKTNIKDCLRRLCLPAKQIMTPNYLNLDVFYRYPYSLLQYMLTPKTKRRPKYYHAHALLQGYQFGLLEAKFQKLYIVIY